MCPELPPYTCIPGQPERMEVQEISPDEQVGDWEMTQRFRTPAALLEDQSSALSTIPGSLWLPIISAPIIGSGTNALFWLVGAPEHTWQDSHKHTHTHKLKGEKALSSTTTWAEQGISPTDMRTTLYLIMDYVFVVVLKQRRLVDT